MQYPVCQATVTVYRKEETGVTRFLVENCLYRYETKLEETDRGLFLDRSCLLVVPGCDFIPKVGDKVMAGIGPENLGWEELLPALMDSLAELNYVRPQYWLGKHCHTEAGRV